MKFLWDGKQDKVKRTEIINEYAEGGLKMLDLQNFNPNLKVKWIQRYLDPCTRGKQKLFVEFFLMGHNIKLLLQGNLNWNDRKWSILNFKKQL